jgi:hypothetical protein
MNHDEKPKVSLEDLLRFKRAEVPTPEFWAGFDEQLRAKQLAALVRRPPWWRRIFDGPSLAEALRRVRLPFGATAILVLSVITLSDSRWTGERPESDDIAAPQVVEPVELGVAFQSGSPRELVVIDTTSVAEQTGDAAAELGTIQESVGTEGLASAGLFPGSFFASDASPSTRSIAANLMAAGEAEPELIRSFMGGATRASEKVRVTMRTTIDPLQQMTPPSEVRLARYRSPLVVASNSADTADRTGERVARRLSDERLYDQINRFGARGDRLQVRF